MRQPALGGAANHPQLLMHAVHVALLTPNATFAAMSMYASRAAAALALLRMGWLWEQSKIHTTVS